MSSMVTSRGLPGVQTSASACSASASISAAVMPSSVRCEGMPTSSERRRTASHAACAASVSAMSAVSTPIASAMWRYFDSAAGALNSMIVGSRSALATPWGMSNREPMGCAMPCTSPRPTLENAMPAMYWATAIASRPSGFVGSFTAVRRLAEIMRIA